MALKLSTASANAGLNGTGFKEQFNLGFLYIFSGTVPATAAEALTVPGTHQSLVKISNNGGATGLTQDAPSSGVLSKAAAETWKGTVANSGTATFYRFCAAGDNGQGVADGSTGYRVQGTVGGSGSGADLELGSTTLTTSFEQPISTFDWTLQGG